MIVVLDSFINDKTLAGTMVILSLEIYSPIFFYIQYSLNILYFALTIL